MNEAEHTDIERTAREQDILEMLAELAELTEDGRIYPDNYHVSHRQSYIEHDGTRLTWNTNGDEFVRVYSNAKWSNYNFNVGPYSVDWKEKRRGGGLDVVHRDDNPRAYNQTADHGNLLNTERIDVRGGIIDAAEVLAENTAFSQEEAEVVEAYVGTDRSLADVADVLALRERTVEKRWEQAQKTYRQAENTVQKWQYAVEFAGDGE